MIFLSYKMFFGTASTASRQRPTISSGSSASSPTTSSGSSASRICTRSQSAISSRTAQSSVSTRVGSILSSRKQSSRKCTNSTLKQPGVKIHDQVSKGMLKFVMHSCLELHISFSAP